MRVFPLVIILAITTYGCKFDAFDSINEKFNFPDSLVYLSGDEFMKTHSRDILKTGGPLVVNVSWGECHVCTIDYPIWDTLVAAGHLGNAQVVFIAITSNPKLYLKIYYPKHGLPGRVVFDSTNWCATLNNKTDGNEMLGTYLLDKERRIVCKGNILKSDQKLTEFRQLIDSLPN